MESKEKNTKEKILEEALKLFAQSGYMGTSMNDIASKLGVTKAALYKHYKSKQEILDSIIEKMNELDIERVKLYEMPEGDLEKVTAEYKETAFDKIKQFTKVQFLHWTEEEFSSCFRKMLTLEQYRESQMAQLYQNYLASGPLAYMEALFSENEPADARKMEILKSVIALQEPVDMKETIIFDIAEKLQHDYKDLNSEQIVETSHQYVINQILAEENEKAKRETAAAVEAEKDKADAQVNALRNENAYLEQQLKESN